jgi:hypothetical protein
MNWTGNNFGTKRWNPRIRIDEHKIIRENK